MKLIVGLGNPGAEYENTRHNVGYMLVNELAKVNNLGFTSSKKLSSYVTKAKDLIIAKPQTFMNSSGISVSKLLNHYSLAINYLYVVHDDLDLRLGEYKIQKGRGPKLHNGVNSIVEAIKTEDFVRIRIGVDNRLPEARQEGEKYVLEKFKADELEIIENTISKIIAELEI